MRIRSICWKRGLSLLELMLVVVLVSIIASLVVVRISESFDMSQCKACHHNRSELNAAIERFGVSTGAYPSDLNDLAVPDYFPNGIPLCPVSGATYLMNSTSHRIDGHTSNTVPGDH
jgi:general secretion pathway protein G